MRRDALLTIATVCVALVVGCAGNRATVSVDEFVVANEQASDRGGEYFHLPDGRIVPYGELRARFVYEAGKSGWIRPARHIVHFDGRVYVVRKNGEPAEHTVDEMVEVVLRWPNPTGPAWLQGCALVGAGLALVLLQGLTALGGMGSL